MELCWAIGRDKADIDEAVGFGTFDVPTDEGGFFGVEAALAAGRRAAGWPEEGGSVTPGSMNVEWELRHPDRPGEYLVIGIDPEAEDEE